MRPQDILMPTPEGLFCKPGGFYIDPVRAVDKALITHGHSDHARAGHGAVLATQETLDLMRLRYGSGFAGSQQAICLRRDADARRCQSRLPSGRPCARLGADLGDIRRHLHRGVGRLQGCRRPDLHTIRIETLRRLHHRGDLRPSGVSPQQARARDRQAAAFGKAVSGARAPCRRLLARQGAARNRDAAADGVRGADLSAWRDGQDHPLLPGARHRARRAQACDRPEQG